MISNKSLSMGASLLWHMHLITFSAAIVGFFFAIEVSTIQSTFYYLWMRNDLVNISNELANSLGINHIIIAANLFITLLINLYTITNDKSTLLTKRKSFMQSACILVNVTSFILAANILLGPAYTDK